MEKVRAALVGCGPRGNSQAEAYRRLPDGELVALCDINEERLRQAGEQHGVRALYTDLDRMIEAERPELVLVATRTDLHAELTLRVLAHGVHVLGEKPIAVELEEADRMVALAEEKHVKFAICHNARYNPVHRKAKRVVKEGIIGKLRMVRATGKGYYGAYGLMNIGTHGLDIVRHYAGGPDWAFAQVTIDGRDIEARDVVQLPGGMGLGGGKEILAHYHFPSGVVALAEFFEREKVDSRAYGWDLVGTEGILSIRGAGDRSIWLYEGDVWLPELAAKGGWREIPLTEEEGTLYGIGGSQAHDLWVVRDVVDAIRQDREPASSGRDGLTVLEMIIATYVSQLTRSRVGFPLQDRRHPLRKLLGEAGLEPPAKEILGYREFLERRKAAEGRL